MNNAKKSTYNILFGIIGQIITISLGIIFPRLILINLGSEVNGLTNSIAQIFSYFTLLEAGIGTASLQALYGPVGKKDYNSINNILAAVDNHYKKTGVIYLLSFIALSIIYPFAIDSNLSNSTIFWVIIFTGLSGVVSYFFQGKYNVLLLAEGKNYINNNLSTITYIISSFLKVVLLLTGYNIVVIQAMYCLCNFLKMLYIEWYIHKNYKWININVPQNKKAVSQSKYVLIHQISSLIFNNTDTVILTFFIGLTPVSIYSMYMLLFGTIGTAIGTITSGVQFVLGQTFNIDRNRYIKLHSLYEILSMVLCFSLLCVANNLILPFMTLYTKGIVDVNYIDKYLPYLFASIYLLSNARESSNITIKFAEHFKQTINRTIIEASINLFVSILCVNWFGIYGVLIGTISALLYRTNDMIIYSSKNILNISPIKTYIRWFRNLIIFITLTIFIKLIPMTLNSYINIIIWAIILTLATGVIFLTINLLFEKEVRTLSLNYIADFIKIKRKNVAEKVDSM
ncbi:MAG: sugar isomerase [Clostridia bacterium]|nr:sugar isomerase [Clostridia bacterium]